jgi:hypothetical protein
LFPFACFGNFLLLAFWCFLCFHILRMWIIIILIFNIFSNLFRYNYIIALS